MKFDAAMKVICQRLAPCVLAVVGGSMGGYLGVVAVGTSGAGPSEWWVPYVGWSYVGTCALGVLGGLMMLREPEKGAFLLYAATAAGGAISGLTVFGGEQLGLVWMGPLLLFAAALGISRCDWIESWTNLTRT